MEPVLHVAYYFSEIDILKNHKIPQKNLDVDNDVSYSPEKFQPEIVCISAYTKMKKSDKAENIRIWHCSPT